MKAKFPLNLSGFMWHNCSSRPSRVGGGHNSSSGAGGGERSDCGGGTSGSSGIVVHSPILNPWTSDPMAITATTTPPGQHKCTPYSAFLCNTEYLCFDFRLSAVGAITDYYNASVKY